MEVVAVAQKIAPDHGELVAGLGVERSGGPDRIHGEGAGTGDEGGAGGRFDDNHSSSYGEDLGETIKREKSEDYVSFIGGEWCPGEVLHSGLGYVSNSDWYPGEVLHPTLGYSLHRGRRISCSILPLRHPLAGVLRSFHSRRLSLESLVLESITPRYEPSYMDVDYEVLLLNSSGRSK